MAKQDIENKIKKDRESIKNDKGFTLLPLNTEEDMRRALRVVLTALVDVYGSIEDIEKAIKKAAKDEEKTP